MNVILLGPPGSGKTTQAQLLADRLGGITIANGGSRRTGPQTLRWSVTTANWGC